jgi:hypothetical protein
MKDPQGDRDSRILASSRDIMAGVAAGVMGGAVPLKISRKLRSLAGKLNTAALLAIRKQDPAQLDEAEKLLREMQQIVKDIPNVTGRRH